MTWDQGPGELSERAKLERAERRLGRELTANEAELLKRAEATDGIALKDARGELWTLRALAEEAIETLG